VTLSRIARLPSSAVWAVRHPVQSTGRAFGFAKGAVAGGLGLVEVLRTPVPEEDPLAPPSGASDPVAPREEPRTAAAPEREAAESEAADTDSGYTVAPPTRQPPAEPPVDVVGQALAAEAEAAAGGAPTAGIQGEPHPVTRDEVHGEAPLVREEREEIEEETAEGLGQDDDEPALPDEVLQHAWDRDPT